MAHRISTHLKDKHNNSGVYQLRAPIATHLYVGQTSRKLKTRYKEHVKDVTSNKPKSGFLQFILEKKRKRI